MVSETAKRNRDEPCMARFRMQRLLLPKIVDGCRGYGYILTLAGLALEPPSRPQISSNRLCIHVFNVPLSCLS